MKEKEYAVYKGEDMIAMGTAEELAEQFGVKVETVKWWSYNTNKKRDKGGRRKVAEVVSD